MMKFALLTATAFALTITAPALAQNAPTPAAEPPAAEPSEPGVGDIIVTAQRQSQRLQDVPIAISAFSAEGIERQQIVNSATLQQSLPSVTFTKTNFATSSFTIRGIGDLCIGATCDSATAIHANDMPLLTTRLFETEFFDLERIEVLRGPQGTLFGRNATSGVVNFITAKPSFDGIHAAGEIEYGNYDSKRAKGMFNLPLTDTLGIRVAGTYLKRDGYTFNEFDNSRIDDRDLYAVRGTLSWRPSSNTRLDLIGYYFREKDNRSRIQKQLCHRDPTGILGCLPDRLANETTNGNAILGTLLASQQFFAVNDPALARFGLADIYGPDSFSGAVNPTDVRRVRLDSWPTYFAEEEQYTAKFFHDFGPATLNVTGGYTTNSVDSSTDYYLAVENSLSNNPGLVALDTLGRAGSPFAFLNGARATLIPKGAAGGVCQSAADPNNLGIFGGASAGCTPSSLDFDRSRNISRQYSVEAHVDSKFDGKFNFLIGGIYAHQTIDNYDYFFNAFGLDYASGILGAASSAAIPGVNGNAFLATPFYRNDSDTYRLKSYGIFGEAYYKFNDDLKLTLGLRYNSDDKFVRARNLTLNVLVPYGATSITQGLNYAAVDFDPLTAGVQDYAVDTVSFRKLTGRAVLDYRIDRDHLLYASYSRGYKSGGINPPLPAIFSVPTTFLPEQVDAFEIGSKNSFGNGALRLNLTGFYYKYKDLQLSRIIARTAVNDNVSANIYGVEAEAILSPIRAFVVNINASYLHSWVSRDKFLSDPRDPSGGRSDAVIIKDISNAANCAVVPTTAGNAAAVNGFVTAVNAGLGLRGPTPIPATNTTGAYSICSVLASQAAAAGGAFQVLGNGVETNIAGNTLPQAPTYKVSAGAQYTIDVGGGFSLVPRVDIALTGNSFGTIFNRNIDRIQGYEVVNAQVQLNAPDDRFFLRAFVQNLTGSDATTGLYVTDQSSGLFTNIFTIEPRRYGVAAGFKF